MRMTNFHENILFALPRYCYKCFMLKFERGCSVMGFCYAQETGQRVLRVIKWLKGLCVIPWSMFSIYRGMVHMWTTTYIKGIYRYTYTAIDDVRLCRHYILTLPLRAKSRQRIFPKSSQSRPCRYIYAYSEKNGLKKNSLKSRQSNVIIGHWT